MTPRNILFGFDPGKRETVIADRGIDLLSMRQLFDGRPVFSYPSPRNGEQRMTTVGELNGKLFAVIWMAREETVWLITARRAWTKEERSFERLAKADDERNRDNDLKTE